MCYYLHMQECRRAHRYGEMKSKDSPLLTWTLWRSQGMEQKQPWKEGNTTSTTKLLFFWGLIDMDSIYASKACLLHQFTSISRPLHSYKIFHLDPFVPVPLETQSPDYSSYTSNVLVTSFAGKVLVTSSLVRAVSVRGSECPDMMSSLLFLPWVYLSHGFHCTKARRSAALPSSASAAVWSLTVPFAFFSNSISSETVFKFCRSQV